MDCAYAHASGGCFRSHQGRFKVKLPEPPGVTDMPINWIDYSIIILYLFVVVYIGWWAMKKVSNFDDYAVAGAACP